MNRPVVAVTADAVSAATWGVWGTIPAAVQPWAYITKVTEAGGSPLLLPPVPEAVEDVMASVDALLITGGADIDPALYGAERDPRTFPPDALRDATDFAALAIAERRGIPVLGICRGLQVIAVSRGGTLHQHLPAHAPTVPGRHTVRDIRVAPDSVLGTAVGASTSGHCHHHQGVAEIGEGLVATAWAKEDGMIEAVEDPSARFLVGFQPHAEEGDSEITGLFKAFVNAVH
ncbi:gamma-glutamyl-gamma-aminobutyrate hydrolase family protein [Streptomyces sp. BPTC-684]|uniref:gamma-glutamyl-gamma-aminobutyrate hydrolase family protein n=1 Tax=Streptomyces sp. BPTC-684 TaxID=3043734 RepID=UPI0024B043D6|nr:gamma-glutamyl-gamma-aminobutyrate hydrolase family protein [Streptomyces sp. BPTC-684]WHM36503.1 gamma-glutamyl-gamma-aminobutyrate hydrolase family protein [Streptomyces sp. BPTC-684]